MPWAYDEAELFEEAEPDEHPLAAWFALPRIVFTALADHDWATAVAMAGDAGLRDANRLTNLVFWSQHPSLVGERIRADQPELASEWYRLRDQLVRPALAEPAPTETADGNRTAIPA